MHTLSKYRDTVTFEDHLSLDDPLAVVQSTWAQGDVLFARPDDTISPVTARGELVALDGELVLVAGQHDHVLVGDCMVTTSVSHADGQGVAVVDVASDGGAVVLHPEHGGRALGAGRWVVLRQREQAEQQRLVAD